MLVDTESGFTVGDGVRATHPDAGDVRGVVSRVGNASPLYLKTGGLFTTVKSFLSNGWELELVKKAPVLLPTMPGFYMDCQGAAWGVTKNGKLCYLSADPVTDYEFNTMNAAAEFFAPFTRLAPEGE